MGLSLASILSESALRYPGRTAVIAGPERIAYRELWEQARAYAGALRRRGIGPGDRVAMMLPNVTDFPRVYYAILALGAVVVPVHALLTGPEVAYVLRDSGAKLLVCAGPLLQAGLAGASEAALPCASVLAPPGAAPACLETEAAAGEPIPEYVMCEPQDGAVILYTSGTTGAPKGALLTHNNLLWNASICAFDLFGATQADVFLGALPLFHSFGQTVVMNTALRVGAAIALLPRFEAESAFETMVGEGVTIYTGVPTMSIALIDVARREARHTQMRSAMSGGAPLPATVLEAFEETFGVPLYEGYGLSETSPVASFNQACFGRKAGTVGRGIWGVELAIAKPDIEDRIEFAPDGELGEVVIRGHAIFAGYLNKPEATRAAIVDGWFRSGDLGTRDADGFISIVDRKKDMILRGGYNVYPREVEEVLMRHPSVKQCAVIGVPHETHGEEIVAVVVRDASGPPTGSAELIEWSQQYLAKYKYPRRVEYVEALPLGPSGKILKRELRAQFPALAG